MIDPTKSKLPMDPSIHSSAYPLLTARMEPLLRGYLGVIERYMRQHSIPMSKIEISGFEDPEEEDHQIVVALWIALPANEAMEQWHRAGRAIEDWVNELTDLEADAIAERIAMEVYSAVDDAAA